MVEHCALGDPDVVRASHDGFAPARHVRTVIRVGDTLAVIDELRDADAPITARWHLAPGLGAITDDAGFAICGDRWLWSGAGDRPLRPRVIETLHSARYLAQQPACTLELTPPGARLVTLIGADASQRDAERRRVLAAIGSVA